MASSPSTDIVDLWKRSEELGKITSTHTVVSKQQTPDSLISERSSIWSNLSQLPPSDQAIIMSRLSASWPYAKERKALTYPIHANIIANGITTAAITTKISSDMILFNPRMGFTEAVRQCPKSPLVFGCYASGVTFFVLYQTLQMPVLYSETSPCPSCLMSRAAAISVATGVLIPMLATPYLCHYILLQRTGDKFPPVKNYLEAMTLCWEGSKAARPLLKWTIPLQIAVAAVATYISLWGRNRMFDTLDTDPDLARDLISRAKENPGTKEKVMDWLRSVPLLSGVLQERPPEKERVDS